MKLRSLAMGITMLASSCVASAAAYNISLTATTPGHYSAAFGATPVVGNFTDTFSFSPNLTPGSSASAYFFNFALDGLFQYNPSLQILFSSADLNGTGFGISNAVPFTQAGVYVPSVSGPLVLTVSGTSSGGSYSGVLNVTMAVPEPQTYGMLLGGLALLGLLGRRKQRQ